MIKIITDSGSDILQEECDKVRVLPLHVSFGEEHYRDGVDLLHETFYEKLIETDVLPKTSQISPYEFMEAYRQELDADASAGEGQMSDKQILVITLSSKLSGTHQSACIAAEEFEGQVYVVDSENVTVGQKCLVMRAVELVEADYGIDEIVGILEEEKKQIQLIALLDTLEYLKKGGRISSVAAVAADVLKIKPVMKFGVGKLDVYQKCRGMKNARKAMIDAMKKEFETNFKEAYEAGKLYLMAASSSTAEVTEEWIRQIKESFPGMDVMCDNLSLGLSCHIGPDGLGIACCNKAE